MSAVIVIPARQGSTRFPGKPLAMIAGRPLLERTWRIAKAVPGVSKVYIATDDAVLRGKAAEMGAEVLMTPPECRNGSERVFAAVSQLKEPPEIVVNLQADAVLTPPWVIEPVVRAIQLDPKVLVATPAVRLSWKQYDEFAQSKAGGKVSGTSVVADQDGDALYFSKGVVPFVRQRQGDVSPVWRHIGLYAYRFEALERYASWEPTPLEQTEGLEQLRFLERKVPIRVVPVDYRGRSHWSVDNPGDVGVVEEIIMAEGELV
jgi:3-deoxy-manno-octulosonate cytidylyltransferase (CMP-KDO synthetase)